MAPERGTAGPYAWLPSLIATVAVAGLAIGYLGLATVRARLVESAGRSLALTAAESVDKLDLVLVEREDRLRRLARHPGLARDDELRVASHLRKYQHHHRDFRWLALVDLDGRVTAANDATHIPDAATLRAQLAVTREVGIDVRVLSNDDGQSVLAFMLPLTDARGRMHGALVAHTGMSRVKRVFDRSIHNLRRHWRTRVHLDWHLVSPNGDLVASDMRQRHLDKLALPSALASSAAAPGYLEERDPTRGTHMVTGYARMDRSAPHGVLRWALLVHIDRRDVVGPIHGTIALLALLWALVTTPLVVLTAWASGRLRREWGESRDESRRAESARRQADASEARMRAVFDHAADGIVAIDAMGTILSCNAAASRMFGLDGNGARGASIARLLPSGADGSHDGTIARWLARIAARPRTVRRVMIGRRTGGERFPVGLALSHVASDDERVFVAILHDLSEQQRAEADRGLLVSIIEHTDDFVALASLEGRVLFVNPAGRALVGLSPNAELGDLALEDFVHASEHTRFRDAIVPAVIAEGRWHGELAGRHLERGAALPVAVSLFLVRHPETGRPTGFAAICHDLREQKRIQAETERAQALVRAKEMAEAASLAKSEFLATMSHEIRTPLNGVVGLTGLLLDTRLSDEQREYAESLGVCTAALLSVIDDVLDYSKMEAGKLVLESIDFDLRRTIQEAVDLFAERAFGKGVELTAAIDPATPSALRGDANRLRQILCNLVSNALKFTARGEIVVRVRPLAEDGDQVRIQIAVSDTGIGIPPERQSMVFDSFSQTDASTARVYGGSGLGLAIVKRLTALMDGQIVVDSEPGIGSTFSLMVPFQRHAAATPPPPLELAGARVLVVDDSPTVRAVLRTYLRAAGVRVASTDDAAHAVTLVRAARARRRPYDLVLLDWEMPASDGIDVARALKDDPAIASVPVVLLTALGQRRAARRATRHLAIAGYLSKPVRTDRLDACLRDVLEPRRRRHAAAPARTVETVPTFPAGHRVLVAEDDPISRKVAVRLLEKRGLVVDWVGDGRGAVEACVRRRYDLVLMDCRLPELDGFAATAAIRAGETATTRTPIVALTASAAIDLERLGTAAGMDGHLRKPIRTEALDDVLVRWIAAPATSASGQAGATSALGSSAAEAAATPILDVAGLLDRVDGDLAFVRELLEGLRRDVPRWLAELRAAIARGDATAVEALAHAVRGSTSNLGGRATAAVAAHIEESARHDRSCAECDDLVRDLAGELERLQHALDTLGDRRVAAS